MSEFTEKLIQFSVVFLILMIIFFMANVVMFMAKFDKDNNINDDMKNGGWYIETVEFKDSKHEILLYKKGITHYPDCKYCKTK